MKIRETRNHETTLMYSYCQSQNTTCQRHASSKILIYTICIVLCIVRSSWALTPIQKGVQLMRTVESPCENRAQPVNWTTITSQERWGITETSSQNLGPSENPFAKPDDPRLYDAITVWRNWDSAERERFRGISPSLYILGFDWERGIVIIRGMSRKEDTRFAASQMIVALWWRHFPSSGPPKLINEVVHISITNSGTTAILNSATRDTGGSLDHSQSRLFLPFPAATSINIRNGYYSIVGSPNGKIEAYMLFQNRALWGNRTIESIQVLNNGTNNDKRLFTDQKYYLKFALVPFDPANAPVRTTPVHLMQPPDDDVDEDLGKCKCVIL